MLESVDLSAKPLKKKAYKEQKSELIEKLVLLQQQARTEGLGLVVLFEGWKGAGKGQRISDLMYNLDARSTDVVTLPRDLSPEAVTYATLENGVSGPDPLMKRFWQELGPRGSMTFYNRGWYFQAEKRLVETEATRWLQKESRRYAQPSFSKFDLMKYSFEPRENLGGAAYADIYLDSIASWERSLSENGYKVVKFFLHVSEQEQHKRLEKLYSKPETRWRVSDVEMALASEYDTLYNVYEAFLERTDYSFAPWHLVNGEDGRAANIAIMQVLVNAITEGLADLRAQKAEEPAQAGAPQLSRFPICSDYPSLDEVDHTLKLNPEEYPALLKAEQKRFNKLEVEMYRRRIPLMVAYEGWDAAGKGGAIKRVAQALDARAYKIYPSPSPTPLELAHPHLWRYWTRLPEAGYVGIYDRTWYGRVLVERVEGLAKPEEWARAYDEINEFERDLVDWGAILIKFWVEVHPDEQLRRFQGRQNDPAKQWKITDEDWRNRDKYPQYYEAVQDMFRLTSTTFAPWTILESDDKMYARIKSLRTINEALEKRIGL